MSIRGVMLALCRFISAKIAIRVVKNKVHADWSLTCRTLTTSEPFSQNAKSNVYDDLLYNTVKELEIRKKIW